MFFFKKPLKRFVMLGGAKRTNKIYDLKPHSWRLFYEWGFLRH